LALGFLHITNGDAFAGILRDASVPGKVLPYREIFNEGPCPAVETLEEWIEIRSGYLSSVVSSFSFEAIHRGMVQFEAELDNTSQYDKVCLWFEHDLYDQLMLIRLLWRFSSQPGILEKLQLVCIGSHPEVPHFHGLGQLSSYQAAVLWETKPQKVTPEQLSLAEKAWHAFTCEDPNDWEILLEEDTSCLPFLKKAVRRHLQQFPSAFNGLCRTETLILNALYQKPHTAAELFQITNHMEEAPYLGDTTFFQYLKGFLSAPEPLATAGDTPLSPEEIEFDNLWNSGKHITLTGSGEKVLMEKEDWLELKGGVNVWRGGVHLEGKQSPWYWHESLGCLLKEKKPRR